MRDIKRERKKGGFRIVLRPQLRGVVVSCRRAGDGWMDGWMDGQRLVETGCVCRFRRNATIFMSRQTFVVERSRYVLE